MMNRINEKLKDDVIFSDDGVISNKNHNWTATNGLIVDVNSEGTTLKMPDVGTYNYSPNVIIEGNFHLSMDILMPDGASFLSFGFNDNQDEFVNFKGWWNADTFKKVNIKCVDGFIKYYFNNQFKGVIEVNSRRLYFQFRIYSPKNSFEFTFKNLKICKLDISKESNEYLLQKIDVLESKIKDLNVQLNDLEKNTSEVLDSYHKYFNTIFVDYQLKPRKLLKYTQTLCLEILNFIGNVCKKYNLEYWLDSGNLLGAIRHGGYIPWDDDMDICMMRRDYEKLIRVIQFEIDNHNLNDVISCRCNFETKSNWISSFVQIVCVHEGLIFGCVDIFPYDFLKDPGENFEERYNYERNKHFINLVNGDSREKVFREVYGNLNLTYEKTNQIVMGVEFGMPDRYRIILDSNKVFPLRYVLFEGHIYPCPNDVNYYLVGIYSSDYLEIPKIGEFHSRQKYLRKKKGVFEIYEKKITLLKKVNDNF